MPVFTASSGVACSTGPMRLIMPGAVLGSGMNTCTERRPTAADEGLAADGLAGDGLVADGLAGEGQKVMPKEGQA